MELHYSLAEAERYTPFVQAVSLDAETSNSASSNNSPSFQQEFTTRSQSGFELPGERLGLRFENDDGSSCSDQQRPLWAKACPAGCGHL